LRRRKRIEFTGVRYRLLRRVNHDGRRLSHPATIGSRVLPAKLTLAWAKRMASIALNSTGAMAATAPNDPNPRVRSCGIGAMRSMSSTGIMPSTELVPSTNIRTMRGAATIVARVMLRTGLRHSPA
jgi:hypothetical protein